MSRSGASSPLRRKLREHVAESILDAAEQVAVEVGVGGITVAAVAQRASVAIGTLYNYFPDTDGILAALFRARRATLVPVIEQAASSTRELPFETRLREFVHRLLAGFAAHDRFVRIAALVDGEGAKLRPRDVTIRDKTIAALVEIMREGARRKLFPAREAPVFARMLHGALRSLFLWPLRDGDRSAALAADGALVVDTFLRGIMPAR